MDLRRGGKAAIDRIIEAYGFTTKQALCDKLGISSSTLANRYTRDSLPTDFIVQCAIETGTSVEWLAFGTENNQQVSPPSQAITEQHQQDAADSIRSTAREFPIEIKINPNQGGKAAIERLVEAYGFTTRQALADHLGVSKSTLANRYLRDTFPSDWIIRCALETGTSLTWLATGNGPIYDDVKNDICAINCKKIVAGELFDSNFFLLDKALLPGSILSPLIISDSKILILCEQKFDEITDGNWLLSVEGKVSIRSLTRIPVGRVKISDNESFFECNIEEIQVIAKCKYLLMKPL